MSQSWDTVVIAYATATFLSFRHNTKFQHQQSKPQTTEVLALLEKQATTCGFVLQFN